MHISGTPVVSAHGVEPIALMLDMPSEGSKQNSSAELQGALSRLSEALRTGTKGAFRIALLQAMDPIQ